MGDGGLGHSGGMRVRVEKKGYRLTGRWWIEQMRARMEREERREGGGNNGDR